MVPYCLCLHLSPPLKVHLQRCPDNLDVILDCGSHSVVPLRRQDRVINIFSALKLEELICHLNSISLGFFHVWFQGEETSSGANGRDVSEEALTQH